MDSHHRSPERLFRTLAESSGPMSWADVRDALGFLGHPDPAIRDDLAYSSLARAVLDGRLDDHLGAISDWLAGTEGLRCRSARHGRVPILARSFSVLIAACVFHRTRGARRPFRQHANLCDAVEDVLGSERTLVSWDARHGWVHVVAHLGDCVDELFEFDDLAFGRADALARGLVDIVTRRRDGLYAFGEYERVAFALATAILRGRLTPAELGGVLNAQRAAAAEFEAPPASVVRANHLRSLGRALEWQLRARGASQECLDVAMHINRALVHRQAAED